MGIPKLPTFSTIWAPTFYSHLFRDCRIIFAFVKRLFSNFGFYFTFEEFMCLQKPFEHRHILYCSVVYFIVSKVVTSYVQYCFGMRCGVTFCCSCGLIYNLLSDFVHILERTILNQVISGFLSDKELCSKI